MEDLSPVEFQLFSFGNKDTKGLLVPEGTMVLEYLGFPYDVGGCTCVPQGPVSYWSKTGVTELDAQWYLPTQRLTPADIPEDLTVSRKVKDHICHALRPNPNEYQLSALLVDGTEVHFVGVVGKKLIFRRLGHSVEIDLQNIPDDQRFTLSVEWGFCHIEIRVTWLEGKDLHKYFSGKGVSDRDKYKQLNVGTIRQFKERKVFDAAIIPANVARNIWRLSKNEITDVDEANKPRQRVAELRKVYNDENDFVQTVINVFTEIQRILPKTKPHGFWNDKTPKREPEAGSTLRLLLEAICAYKNIRVYQEDPSRSGNVDFVFVGISKDSDHLELVLEIKQAHSDRLERGLTHQLPQYLRERDVKFGVYGVLWYKGRDFDRPTDMSLEECVAKLQRIKPDNIAHVLGFDVSFQIQASKLRKGVTRNLPQKKKAGRP